MNHLYADFAKNTEIEKCFFRFVKTNGGHLYLDDIHDTKCESIFGEVLSFEESLLRKNFLIKYKKGVSLKRKNFESIVKEIIKNRK